MKPTGVPSCPAFANIARPTSFVICQESGKTFVLLLRSSFDLQQTDKGFTGTARSNDATIEQQSRGKDSLKCKDGSCEALFFGACDEVLPGNPGQHVVFGGVFVQFQEGGDCSLLSKPVHSHKMHSGLASNILTPRLTDPRRGRQLTFSSAGQRYGLNRTALKPS